MFEEGRLPRVLLPLIALSILGVGCQQDVTASAEAELPPPDIFKTPGAAAVSCLGRIEPKNGVTRVSAAYFNGRPALISELRVEEGDWVETGEILAVTNSLPTKEARVRQLEARIPVMRIQLEQVREGPKAGDVAAQKAEIARLRIELETARAEYARYQQLHEVRDVSDSQLDLKQLAVRNIEKMIEQAQQRLDSMTEIRDVDVRLAQSRLDAAIADVEEAKADVEMSLVRAPSPGRILEIHARAGEEVGMRGLLELARTDQLYVVAEVYETDISRVKPGQRATIQADYLSNELSGTVETISQQIDRGQVLPADPVEFADARIVKVDIGLDDSAPAAGLIHGRVAVTIHP